MDRERQTTLGDGDRPVDARAQRAAYEAPWVRKLGSVRELTLAPGTLSFNDGFGTKSKTSG